MRKKLVVKYFAGSVPSRPTVEEVNASWTKLGIGSATLQALLAEHNQTLLFNHSDSTVRAKLLKRGGQFFPQDLHCVLRKKYWPWRAPSFPTPDPYPSPASMVMERVRRMTSGVPFLAEAEPLVGHATGKDQERKRRN